MVHAGLALQLCSAAPSGLGAADNGSLLRLAAASLMPSPQMYGTWRAKHHTHPVFQARPVQPPALEQSQALGMQAPCALTLETTLTSCTLPPGPNRSPPLLLNSSALTPISSPLPNAVSGRRRDPTCSAPAPRPNRSSSAPAHCAASASGAWSRETTTPCPSASSCRPSRTGAWCWRTRGM